MLFQNAAVWRQGRLERMDAVFSNGDLVFSHSCSVCEKPDYFILPGFCDVHVHLREPGFCYKETVKTGTMAAARGGYTALCSMPNLNPVPDCAAALQPQKDAIARDACVPVFPYGALTVGEKGETPAALEELAPDVLGFSDDGRGIQSEAMMVQLMRRAKALGRIIVAHCEDNRLLHGGYIHDGAYAKAHGHKGICSESEWGPIARDLRLAGEIGCKYHVCHISTKESVALIRQAKAEGVDVTCETAPHYLVFNDQDLREEGRFKMNPPIRSEADRQALLEGILDGTIDIIATDHAPHAQNEKDKGLAGSAFGIVGLETAFPALYTGLVQPGLLTVERLVELLSENPRKRFGIQTDPGWCVWDVREDYTVKSEAFLSMGKSTPWEGCTVRGKNLLTLYSGKPVYVAQ